MDYFLTFGAGFMMCAIFVIVVEWISYRRGER